MKTKRTSTSHKNKRTTLSEHKALCSEKALSKQKAFTLIEVMISLLIFATGMLGVTYQMSQSIKNTINNEVHSSVMQVALQSIEPLRRSVTQTTVTFITQLKALRDNGSTPPFAGNSNQENFQISIDSAVDNANNSLFGNAATVWQPPFTVVLRISYDTKVDYGGNSTTLEFFTTHVLVPRPSAG